MFSKFHTHLMVGAVLTMGLAASLLGTGSASADTMVATSTSQLIIQGGTSVAPGTVLTVQGTGYTAGEPISLWINVPDGTVVPQDSLGQTDTAIVGTVIPLDNKTGADAYGAFTYTLDTTGLPSGNYSLVAYGSTSGLNEVSNLTITGPASTQAPQTAASGATLSAGTMFNVQGTGYTVGEPISFWINIPNGTIIPSDSLGQTDTATDGSVITVDGMATADAYGQLTYSQNTSALPMGNYSLVAHGMTSGVEKVFPFTINGSGTTPMTSAGSTAVAAGTILTIRNTGYDANEPVGLWINVPDGTTISSTSLGQTDTTIVETVIPLDNTGSADAYGAFTYTLDTTGLPSGNYSLVAYGLNSLMTTVMTFSIK